MVKVFEGPVFAADLLRSVLEQHGIRAWVQPEGPLTTLVSGTARVAFSGTPMGYVFVSRVDAELAYQSVAECLELVQPDSPRSPAEEARASVLHKQ